MTARKRKERAQDVPDSLVVLNDAMLEKLQVKQAGDVGKIFPNIGLKQDLSVTSTFISVRGITATRNTDPAVSLVVDGVQATSASEIRQQLFDVERMEVLKGPQGSLYGRNAIAGAINVVTKMPGNEEAGRASLGFGNAGSVDAAIALTGPIITDKLFFRASAGNHDDDGTVRSPVVANHTVDFKSDKTAKLRLVYKPSERLTMDFKYSHDEYEGGAYYFVVTRPPGAPFPSADPDSNSNTFSRHPESVPISVNFSTIHSESLRLNYDFGAVTLASVTAHNGTRERYGLPGEGIGGNQPGDLDFTPANIIATPQTYNVDSWSEELRLSSNATGPLRMMGGAYVLSSIRNDSLPVYILGGSADPADWFVLFPLGTHRTIKAYAAFSQIDYDFTDRFTATFGIRYDREDRDQFDKDDPTAPLRDARFSLSQPKLSLTYKVQPNQMLYATVSRGFRSGGFNTPRSIFDVTFAPEKLWNYELGYKGEWLGNRLRTNLAAFYEDIEDKQDFVFDAVNASQTVYNIPKSRITGVELELAAEPSDALVLSANVGVMDSRIEEFRFGPLFPVPQVDAQLEGNKVPGFSHWGVQLAGDYTRALSAEWTGTAHIDYSVRGKGYWDVTNIDVEKNIHLVSADFGIRRGRYSLDLWATNLLDTKYWSNWFNQQTTGLPDVGYPAEERRFGVRLSATF
ncbi:MAG: TonB-dependent receptor [Gammaproteobacteria bacterium]